MSAPFATPQALETPTREANAWPQDRLEVRFESPAAFERGLALAREQGGVRVARADQEALTLVLQLRDVSTPETPALLH